MIAKIAIGYIIETQMRYSLETSDNHIIHSQWTLWRKIDVKTTKLSGQTVYDGPEQIGNDKDFRRERNTNEGQTRPRASNMVDKPTRETKSHVPITSRP